jgi:hypothetical protein
VSYNFTIHKNGTRDEKIFQGRSGISLRYPIQATVCRIKHHRLKKSTSNAPIASYYFTAWHAAIKPKDVTDTLCHAMRINFHRIGINSMKISA